MLGHRALCRHRGGDTVPRGRERDEAAVAGRVDLGPAVPLDDVAQQPTLVVQEVAVAIAQHADQAGRSLEIREEERDGTGGQCGQGSSHGAPIVPATRACAQSPG